MPKHGSHKNLSYFAFTATPKPKTSHTLNPVPFYVVGKDVQLKQGAYGLANIAATLTDLLEVEKDPSWEESLIA